MATLNTAGRCEDNVTVLATLARNGHLESIYKHVKSNVLSALASHAELKRAHRVVEAAVNDRSASTDQLQAAIQSSAGTMAALEDFLTTCLKLLPTDARLTARSSVLANKVLCTPELLEAIFSYLSPPQLLKAIRMSKQVYAISQQSPTLLGELHLRLHPDGFFSNVISTQFPGLRVYAGLDPMDPNGPPSLMRAIRRIPITVKPKRRRIPRIGSRCQSILVIHPPLASMKAFVSCCSNGLPAMPQYNDDDGDHATWAQGTNTDTDGNETEEARHNAQVNEHKSIHCRKGITVRHILDAVRRIRDAHRLCPHAKASEHDAHGVVIPNITFCGTLELRRDDPYLWELDRKYVHHKLERTKALDDPQVMDIYIETKRRAFENGWPVLTLDEFKTKYNVDALVGTRIHPDPFEDLSMDFLDGWDDL